MTEDDALARLAVIHENRDEEVMHIEEDNLMLEIIRGLGWHRFVEARNAMGRWYA